MKIASVVGTRPNFIKLAPIHKVVSTFSEHTIIHTGQHYDYNLSEIFFKEFDLPKPNFDLEIGSGRPGFQIGEMIKRIEEVFLDYQNKFELVLVYGDSNSTFAGALSAKRSEISVAHIESGLRSFDRFMPEEINRVLTDNLSDYLFAPTQNAVKNLQREHVFGKVSYTGDIAVEIIQKAVQLTSKSLIINDLQLVPKSYILFTMHRAENTVSHAALASVICTFEILLEEHIKVVFPIHPRTAKILNSKKNLYSKLEKCKNVKVIQPVGYVDFIKLIQNAKKVITDSGGVQKESYLLGIPCITIRKNTEWIETVDSGWNILTGIDTKKIVKAIKEWMPSLSNNTTTTNDQRKPIFGSGMTSKIIKSLIQNAKKKHS